MTSPEVQSKVAAYNGVSAGLHWLVAAMLVASFGLGVVMTEIPAFPPIKAQYYAWHKSLGVAIFPLAVLAVLWRIAHPAPPLPSTVPTWQVRAAKTTHYLLYALMLLLPLSGYLKSAAAGYSVVFFYLLPLPALIEKNKALAEVLGLAHSVLGYTMAAIVLVHFAAALKHHFIAKNGMLARMVPWFGRRKN